MTSKMTLSAIRRIVTCISLLTLVLLFGFGRQQHTLASTQDFNIESFSGDYRLGRSDNHISLLDVTETIVAVFPDFDQNHGILRAIPKTYQDHTLSLKVISVTDQNGQTLSYDTYGEQDNLVLKIGDADRYVRGRQTYVINYTMRNVISFYDDHQEFYWDINGDQWQQPFASVTARIHIPADLSAQLQPRQECFAGAFQTSSLKCSINQTAENGGTLITASVGNLSPAQTLTTVLGFNKDTFVLGPEIAAEKRRQQLLLILAGSAVILPPLFTSIYTYRRWRRYGRDPKGRGIIIPEYSPPKDFNALTSSVILNERLDSKAVSALIIELAVSKFIRIYEVPKKGLLGKADYELEIIKDPKDPAALSAEQQQALRMFFGGGLAVGNKVKLSSLKNKLHSEIGTLGSKVNQKLYEQGYFANNPDKVRSSYVTRGVVLLVIGIAISFTGIGLPLGIGLGLSGIVLMLVSKTMPARSLSGVTIRDYLLGLKNFIELAEKDRINFLQSPAGAEKLPADTDSNDINNPKEQIKLFEKLLPYAMLFGLEKQWAKQFKDLYSQPPDWYQGNWSSFNAVYLASSIGNFNAASGATFTSPSSSSSSGFGGGGFSGGGGGGGGGGGW